MNYKINRLERSTSSQGLDEIFFQVVITDGALVYPYAMWMHYEDVMAVKEEMGDNFYVWNHLGEFNFLNKNSTALSIAITESFPIARQQYDDQLIEKQIDQARRLREAQGG